MLFEPHQTASKLMLNRPLTQLDTRELLEAEIIGMQEQLAGFILDEVLAEDGKFNIIHALPPQD